MYVSYGNIVSYDSMFQRRIEQCVYLACHVVSMVCFISATFVDLVFHKINLLFEYNML